MSELLEEYKSKFCNCSERTLKLTTELVEARAEVERLRRALEKVMLCSHPPTGRTCNCYRQGDAALRRSAPLVTEGEP